METVKDIVQKLKNYVSEKPQQQPVETVTDARAKLAEMTKSHKERKPVAGVLVSKADLQTIADNKRTMQSLLKDMRDTDALHLVKSFYSKKLEYCLDCMGAVLDKFQM